MPRFRFGNLAEDLDLIQQARELVVQIPFVGTRKFQEQV